MHQSLPFPTKRVLGACIKFWGVLSGLSGFEFLSGAGLRRTRRNEAAKEAKTFFYAGLWIDLGIWTGWFSVIGREEVNRKVRKERKEELGSRIYPCHLGNPWLNPFGRYGCLGFFKSSEQRVVATIELSAGENSVP